MPKSKQLVPEKTLVSSVSDILLNLLLEYNFYSASESDSMSHYDWNVSMRNHTDILAEALVEEFDKRYRLKD